MNPQNLWFLLLLTIIGIMYVILRNKKSRKQFTRETIKTSYDTTKTFVKGMGKAFYKSGKTAFKEERKKRKERKNEEEDFY